MSVKKIAVIGPESTGKSTLSEALAKALNTVWVPEYAREYLNKINRTYQEEDLLQIAKGQTELEDSLLAQAKDHLICDTDLNVIKVWSEHKYNKCHSWILEQIATRRYDLYLLTYIDIAWQNDLQREHPEEKMRHYFYQQYKEIVINSNVPFAMIQGAHEERLWTSLHAIERIRN